MSKKYKKSVQLKNHEKTNKSQIIEEKSLFDRLKVKKIDGLYCFTKTGLIFLCIIMILLFGFGCFLGKNVDFKGLSSNSSEKIQAKIEKSLAEDIAIMNEQLEDANKLESKATYTTEGTVNDYDYYQYVSYSKSYNAYASWIVNKENNEVLAFFVTEQHIKDGEEISKKIMDVAVNTVYKDKIKEEDLEKINTIIPVAESSSYEGTDLVYMQQYQTEDLDDETIDYACIQEIDFFIYVPETESTEEVEE